MKNFIKAIAAVATSCAFVFFCLVLYVQYIIPDNLMIDAGQRFAISDRISLTTAEQYCLLPKVEDAHGNLYGLRIDLRGQPAQEVLSYVEPRMVVPGGNPFGIKLHTEGVLVVGMTDIQVDSKLINPAKEAGIKVGDVITHIDGHKLESSDCVRYMVAGCEGAPLEFTLLRADREIQLTATPVLSEFDRAYKTGIWVRDSSAGIGTMTYFDPQSGVFAGLGHAVCDIDTGMIMPLAGGEIVDVNISGVNPGQSGSPGELKGSFLTEPLGELRVNSESGLFGVLSTSFISHDLIPMARRQEVEPGPAVIFATISGNKPQAFEVIIEKVNHSDISPTKNLVVRIIDEGLLSATGGIVQGMSGSPIIQNGKLVGAVTHVFVNDPTRGYGIFAENMDRHTKFVESSSLAA